MMEKQTVCIANEETKRSGYNAPEGFTCKYGYFLTAEQLNEYTHNVIKQALETASENVELTRIKFTEDYEVNKQSITNAFEDVYDKFKV